MGDFVSSQLSAVHRAFQTERCCVSPDLGSLFGIQVPSSALEKKHPPSPLTLYSKCGAWGCFDEFNRLKEDQLSAISQQIQLIQDAIKAKRPSLKYDRRGVFSCFRETENTLGRISKMRCHVQSWGVFSRKKRSPPSQGPKGLV